MFQVAGHGPQVQEALVLLCMGEVERQEEVLLQQHLCEEQPLCSACCALAGLPLVWHDQLALLYLVGRLWMRQLEWRGRAQKTQRKDSMVGGPTQFLVWDSMIEKPSEAALLMHCSPDLFALQPDQ